MLLTGHRGNGLNEFIRKIIGKRAVYVDVGGMLEAGGASDDQVFLRTFCRCFGYWPQQGMDRHLSAVLDLMLPGSGKLSRENEVLVQMQRVFFAVTKALITFRRRRQQNGEDSVDKTSLPLFVVSGFTAENKDRRPGFFNNFVSWAAYVSEAGLARVVFVADSSFGEPAILNVLQDRPERLSVLQVQDVDQDSVRRILDQHFGPDKSPALTEKELAAVGGRFRDISALVAHLNHNALPAEAVRRLLEGSETTVRRLLMTGQPGVKWTRPQLWRAIRLFSSCNGSDGVPYDVFLWAVFRGDEAALRSMKESNLILLEVYKDRSAAQISEERVRYKVMGGSPLYSEVFRRLVENEGLAAVLDVEVAKEDIKREQATLDGYEAELVRLEEILDVRRDWWFRLHKEGDDAIVDRKRQLIGLIKEQHQKLEKYHKARQNAMAVLSRCAADFQRSLTTHSPEVQKRGVFRWLGFA